MDALIRMVADIRSPGCGYLYGSAQPQDSELAGFAVYGCGVRCSGLAAWLHGFWQSLEGFALGALVYGMLSWIGGMGMGDVKLVAAIGAWIGPRQLLMAMVLIAMTGGLMALGFAIVGIFKGEVWKSRTIPYAPAIAVGTLISFFSH